MASLSLENIEDFVQSLRRFDGRVTHAAEHAGISYQLAKRLLKRKVVKDAMDEIEQRLLDDAEASLVESMRSFDTKNRQWSVPLMLKTKGKHRGFNEQMPKESGALSAGRYEIEINEVDDWRERR